MRNVARLPESDRRELFRNTADKMGLNDAIVEKDFWVCFTLDYLFHRCPWKDAITFKGGTSLSKAFNLISRFSEDIDLILDWRVLGYGKDEPWEKRSNTKQDQSTAKVGVFVEVVDEDLSSLYDFSTPRRARSVVDLSAGQDTFTVGTLQANSTYRTNTYSITKSTIKIGLQSIAGASPHIKVTLYKSNGVSVAATTMNLPWSSPMSGGTTYVSFTNLDTAYNYYAVIQNMDTVQTGTILGIAKQK